MRSSSFSLRLADQVLNSKLALKQEIDDIIHSVQPSLASFHELLELGIVGAVTKVFSVTEISNRRVTPETL